VLINSLQTLHPQDHSLTEAVQLFRNHQELQPILDKLNELDAKLRAELQNLIDKLDASKSASAQTRSDASTICERVELKRLESSNAVAALNAATAQRDEAQLLFNSMQTLWTTTRTKTESALQTYTQEMINLNSLRSCSVASMNPIRKSCWEIKSLHPSAPSGEYRIQGPDGQPVNVLCDMIGEGGGWTLAAVALFDNHGQAGWNDEGWLNKESSNRDSSHWHMSSAFMNTIATNAEYRANCFDSTNNYARLWSGVKDYKWHQVSSAASSTSLDGSRPYPTTWAAHHWGLTSGNNEHDALITSHSGNQWACAGNAGPNGEGYTGRGGRSNMRIWLR